MTGLSDLPKVPRRPAPPAAEAPVQGTAPDPLRSARFRFEREEGWRRLDTLVTRAEARGMRALSYAEARDLAALYRQAMSSLSVARDISLDRSLLEYLEALCARAWLVVYAPQEPIGPLFARLFTQGIPQAVRRSALALLIGFLAMVLGAITGWALYLQDPAWFYTFVPPDLAGGRTPEASTATLRDSLYDTGWTGQTDALGAFAAKLFSHNTQIAILIFALGAFAAAPSFLLTFYNGLILGAFFMVFAEKGLGFDLFAWLSIHGVTELAAICIACAGGARLGLAVLLPGPLSRAEALRREGPDAVKLMILAALMLIVAALVEGYLRQIITAPGWRLAIGWGLGLGWLAWLALAGRGRT
jgi:uncharacterized membrane protein SpoIIM required for sporulation